MLLWTMAKGIGLGVAIAAPVGPIGLLCIRRSLAQGRWMGLATGLGAATADGLYGAVAGFGLTAVADMLIAQATALRIVGGLIVFVLFGLHHAAIATCLRRGSHSLRAGATRSLQFNLCIDVNQPGDYSVVHCDFCWARGSKYGSKLASSNGTGDWGLFGFGAVVGVFKLGRYVF